MMVSVALFAGDVSELIVCAGRDRVVPPVSLTLLGARPPLTVGVGVAGSREGDWMPVAV